MYIPNKDLKNTSEETLTYQNSRLQKGERKMLIMPIGTVMFHFLDMNTSLIF